MNRVFVSWIGFNDLQAESKGEQGAVLQCLLEADVAYDRVVLLTTNLDETNTSYQHWLEERLKSQRRYHLTTVNLIEVALDSPIDYCSIYSKANEILEFLVQSSSIITLGISSGTPAMSTVWMLLAKGVYNLKCVQSSVQSGVQSVELPVDLSLHYLASKDSSLARLMSEEISFNAFSEITTNSEQMKRVVHLAKKIAPRNVPVIIQGPTGSGKEVLANAIHGNSQRANKTLVVVNCGAIPENLIESALFGHKRGSFTGAIADKKGYFSEADGGTLFLDEVGELSHSAQVQLLRALQQGEIQRVGEDKPTKVNVRVIAATHRDLMAMVESGEFREDLFYRLAVGVLTVPGLGERKEDIIPLAEHLLEEINQEAKDQPGYRAKALSPEAKQFIYTQRWPGNVRELKTTLLRASVWSEGDVITAANMADALIHRSTKNVIEDGDITSIPEGFDLSAHVSQLKKAYIEQALVQTKFKKKDAAQLLGVQNHQTLTNWAKKVGLDI